MSLICKGTCVFQMIPVKADETQPLTLICIQSLKKFVLNVLKRQNQKISINLCSKDTSGV